MDNKNISKQDVYIFIGLGSIGLGLATLISFAPDIKRELKHRYYEYKFRKLFLKVMSSKDFTKKERKDVLKTFFEHYGIEESI